jgi:hypothetical protein
MEVRRTVPVALDVASDDAALLEDTVDTFLWSAQYVVDHAFTGEYVTTSKTTLDDETYDDVREVTDGFNGGLVQAARNKAAEACKSVVARWKNDKKASKPVFTARTSSTTTEPPRSTTTAYLSQPQTVASKLTRYSPTRTATPRTRRTCFQPSTKQRAQNCTTRTVTGCSTSTARWTWSPTRRHRRPPRTDRFSGLTSA